MQTTASHKIKIGIFTLVGICVLVMGIFLIGKKQNLFGDTFSIYGTFKNVGGLQVGNNIRFAGINVGTVENIKIINEFHKKPGMHKSLLGYHANGGVFGWTYEQLGWNMHGDGLVKP